MPRNAARNSRSSSNSSYRAFGTRVCLSLCSYLYCTYKIHFVRFPYLFLLLNNLLFFFSYSCVITVPLVRSSINGSNRYICICIRTDPNIKPDASSLYVHLRFIQITIHMRIKITTTTTTNTNRNSNNSNNG